MIFRSKMFSATWDTWIFYKHPTYYCYYLITEHSPGEAIGVATSRDGVHWEDHGIAIDASDKMVHFIGSGSVYADPFNENRYIMNYSEWRRDETNTAKQNIFFAWSDDLINWHKFGDQYMFSIDRRYYEANGRWDCINSIKHPEGGYWGSWTATPTGKTNGGIGFGFSRDGVKWEALPPPHVTPEVNECGSFIEYDGRVYAMFGRLDTGGSMHSYVAGEVLSEYKLSGKNPILLKPYHTYFSRYFYTNDGILINHHAMNGEINEYGRPITFLSPFKRFSVDAEGIQRWKYWEGNEKLKGKQGRPEDCFSFQKGVILEAIVPAHKLPANIILDIDDYYYSIRVTDSGKAEFTAEEAPADWQKNHGADREITWGDTAAITILAQEGMLELYVNNHFMECWTMGCPRGEELKIKEAPEGTRCFEMNGGVF